MKKLGIQFNEERPNKYYSEVVEKGILGVVKRLYKQKARFITATGFENESSVFYIYYHFELSNKLYTIKAVFKDRVAQSVASVYPTASWIEREITDLYGIKFKGLENQKPLILAPEYNHPFKND